MHTRQTASPIYSEEFAKFVLAAYLTNPAAALLDTPVVGLWRDPAFNPTPQSTKADFDAAKCTFTDYAKQALGGVTPVTIGVPGYAVQGVPQWAMTTDPVVTGNIVLGYWVEDADRVVAYEKFADDEVVAMNALGNTLILEVLLPLLLNQPVAA